MKRFFDLINKNFRTSGLKPFSFDELYQPLITISREKGSGGGVAAAKVVEALGKPWAVFNKQIVDEIAAESHFEKELIKHVDEDYISDVEKLIDEIFGKRYLNLPGYYRHLLKVLSSIGRLIT